MDTTTRYPHTMKHALLAIILAACTPEDEAPSSGTSSETSSTETGTSDETGTETGEEDDNGGIVLDVGPPHYGTEETG